MLKLSQGPYSILYKKKPLEQSLEVHVQEFMSWLNLLYFLKNRLRYKTDDCVVGHHIKIGDYSLYMIYN